MTTIAIFLSVCVLVIFTIGVRNIGGFISEVIRTYGLGIIMLPLVAFLSGVIIISSCITVIFLLAQWIVTLN